MRKFRPRRPSVALIVSVVALFVALGGTAVAARYIITSVSQIKPSVVHALKGNRGPAGPRGPQGPRAVRGPQGTSGIVGLVTVEGAKISLPAGGYGSPPDAECPAGSSVVGTGWNGPMGTVGAFVKAYGDFVGGWFANDSSIPIDANVQAICARLAPGASAATRAAADRQAFQRDVAAARQAWRASKAAK